MTSRRSASPCVANRSEYARECLPIRALSAGRLTGPGARPALSTGCQGRDEIEYVRGLGLIAPDAPLRIANPVHAEVAPRELTLGAQAGLLPETAWYVRADGGLDVLKLLGAFQEFFREHSERRVEQFQYREAAPQLLPQAFCQRIVDSRGRVEREYGPGRERVDLLLLLWPQGERRRKFVVECKLLRDGLPTLRKGLEQMAGSMDPRGAGAGHLVAFRPRFGEALGGEGLAAGGGGAGRPEHHRPGQVSAPPPQGG